jgi:thioredoxin 1
MTDSNLLHIDGNNFESTLKSNKVVLIDFWAEWCMPCKMFLPIVAEIAEEFKGKAAVGKVNVDENEELQEKFGIMSIPTVIVFVDGAAKEKFVGSRPKAFLKEVLNKYTEEKK